MEHYQQEQKGLFTFYKEQDEFEQNLKKRLREREANKLQQRSNFKKDHESYNHDLLRKDKAKNQESKTRLSHVVIPKKQDQNVRIKDSQKQGSAGLQKNKLNRNRKLLKMVLKKTENDEQSGKHLKSHLQELLRTEQSEAQATQQLQVENASLHPIKEKITDTRMFIKDFINTSNNLNQPANIEKVSRQKIQMIHTSEGSKQILKNIVFPKTNEDTRQENSDKFPRINKKSHSQKLRKLKRIDTTQLKMNIVQKTRYLSPNKASEQQYYLAPICTERRKITPYALNLEYYNPHRRLSKETSNNQTILSLRQGEKDQIMRDLVRKIKFE